MKQLTFLLTALLISATAFAAQGTWRSTTTGNDINYKTTDASNPAKDAAGKLMTVVYLENLTCEKIGQNSNADDVAWLLGQGYRVIELDYAHHTKAVSPYINLDIISINKELNKGTFCGCTNISTDRAYILFEGYRLHRNISYYKDDPTIYNLPDAYAKTAGDSLYLDLVYPANPSREVPTILSFSYSNSYSGKEHKRMFLGYSWAMFNDSFMEGAPAVGVAWAIADHPKYCDWGNGKYTGGANKSMGAIEVNPDAACKVRSAIRTVRGTIENLTPAPPSRNGVYSITQHPSPNTQNPTTNTQHPAPNTQHPSPNTQHPIFLYGFSRGSTAASLALGIAPNEEWNDVSRGRFPEENATIQGAFLGPGVFDYSLMSAESNEYKRMDAYLNAMQLSSDSQHPIWDKGNMPPCFLFYNSDDDKNYDTQMNHIIDIFNNNGVTYELLKDYGSGHSVPQTCDNLDCMYKFLQDKCINTETSISVINSSPNRKQYIISPDGCLQHSGLLISDGKKYLVK